MSDLLVPFVNALIVLDSDGERMLAKYYDHRNKFEQSKTEQFLHKKTKSVRNFSVLIVDFMLVLFCAIFILHI